MTQQPRVTREAGDMIAHFAEVLRHFLPIERPAILAELVDIAERQGRIAGRTAFQLRDRATEILAAMDGVSA